MCEGGRQAVLGKSVADGQPGEHALLATTGRGAEPNKGKAVCSLQGRRSCGVPTGPGTGRDQVLQQRGEVCTPLMAVPGLLWLFQVLAGVGRK